MTREWIHLIGIGGISMSGIAEYLLDRGFRVSGSDLKKSEHLDRLQKLGADIYIGHSRDNLGQADRVVVSSAIPGDNPELLAARERGVQVLKRAEIIAHFMQHHYGLAVSGTHGKTTTTSMIAGLLNKDKFDPTIMVGADLSSINGNVRVGTGDYFLTEADESDGSLLYFDPMVAVITNIELDHPDYYDSRQKLKNTFREFIDKIPDSGKVIVWAEDKTIKELVDFEDSRLFSYGFNSGDLRAYRPQLLPFGSYFTVDYNGHHLGEINLQVPGEHNILNALAAVAVGMFIGLNFSEIKSSLEQFSGAARRFEKKGLINNVLIVDDYAHHPTEIKATLKAAANTGYNRLIAVFQPHRYTRTSYLMDDFARSFELVDHLIVTDIYSAGEQPIPGVTAERLVHKIAISNDLQIDYIREKEDIVYYLQKILQPRDLLITIGAGNIYQVGEMLVNNYKRQQEMAE
ncbi:MAG: UDP-N-acetylmuramate--L-alanine ligase [Bacillota bacterium]